MLRKVLGYLILYIALFSIEPSFLPIRLRHIFAITGLYLMIKDYHKIALTKRQRRSWHSLFLCFVVFLFWIVVSSFYNSYFDATLIKYPISVLLSFLSSYAAVTFFCRLQRKDYDTYSMMRCVVWVSLFECLFTLFLFLTPSVQSIIFGLLRFTDLAADSLDSVNYEARMMGIGVRFFGGGVFLGVVLFYISTLLISAKSKFEVFILLISFVIIASIGVMVARTALVGVVAFVTHLLMGGKLLSKTKFLVLIGIVIVGVISYDFYVKYLESNPLFELVFDRVFLLFDPSRNQDVERYVGGFEKPLELVTWILGDAKMADPQHPTMAYYKGIDIGIWRLIWGYGIPGLVIYCIIQYMLCKLAGFKKFEVFILFGMCVIFLNKGLISMDVIVSIFIMLNIYNARNKNYVKMSQV